MKPEKKEQVWCPWYPRCRPWVPQPQKMGFLVNQRMNGGDHGLIFGPFRWRNMLIMSCHVPLRLHPFCKASKVGPSFELLWKMGFHGFPMASRWVLSFKSWGLRHQHSTIKIWSAAASLATSSDFTTRLSLVVRFRYFCRNKMNHHNLLKKSHNYNQTLSNFEKTSVFLSIPMPVGCNCAAWI